MGGHETIGDEPVRPSRAQRAYWIKRRLIDRMAGETARIDEVDSLYDPLDQDVLDYGWCGDGDRAAMLIGRGARHVAGFDRWWDEPDLERVGGLLEHAGISEQVDFRLADPYATPWPDDGFDLVIGRMILQHLDLEAALTEIRRVLRPGGRAIFVEPLAANPVLRLGRAVSGRLETEAGRPLTERDWATCRRHFPGFRHHERELATMLLFPANLVLPERARQCLVTRVSAFDEQLLERCPRLRRYARLTFLILE